MTPAVEAETRDAQNLKEYVTKELANQERNQVPVALVWRAMKITGLRTKYLDETVPPPPMPPTPMPIAELEIQEVSKTTF